MPYLAIAACLGWVATACLLAWLLSRVLTSQQEERIAHRIEVDAQRQENAENARSHREEIAALNQARIEEVSNLLQRIQDPPAAVAEHAARNAEPDPPPVDLEDDSDMFAAYQQRMDMFKRELEGTQ